MSATQRSTPGDLESSVWGGLLQERRFVAPWLAIVLSIGTLLFLYRYLAELAENNYVPARYPLITEMTGAFGAGLLFLVLLRFIRRFPLDAPEGYRHLPIYVVALLVYAVAHTSFMWGSRAILFPLFGLGAYDYGRMPLRYFMEFPIQLVGFCIMVAAVHAVRHFRATKEREIQTAQLESSLARAQLQNLRLQLQPHFLFNTLNTISSTMYDDPQAADEMLDRLSELLRISLKTAQTDEVPLSTEIETLDCYLSIMKARFGERLSITMEVDPSTLESRVPSMILQPLVENAIRHGNAEKNGAGRIRVVAARSRDHIRLVVEDDGPGAPDDRSIERGVGLSATEERLRLLYDDRHCFETMNLPDGGFRVALEIPEWPAIQETIP